MAGDVRESFHSRLSSVHAKSGLLLAQGGDGENTKLRKEYILQRYAAKDSVVCSAVRCSVVQCTVV